MALGVWQAHIQDAEGNVVPGATVTVLREVTGLPPAALYEDRNAAVFLGNVVQADADGYVRFYAAGGFYRITVTATGLSRTWYDVPIGTAAGTDASVIPTSFSPTWLFDSQVDETDPGDGEFKLNNADPTLATEAFISETTESAASVATWLALLDDFGDTNMRGLLTLFDPLNPLTVWHTYRIEGTSTDNGTWWSVTLEWVAGQGTFDEDASTQFQFVPRGPAGTMTQLSDDLSPDLGGDLNLNGFGINSPLLVNASGGSEGGEITLEAAPSGSTLNGNLVIDTIAPTRFRIFESGSPNRGYFADISRASNAAAMPLMVGGRHTVWVPANAMTPRTTNGAAIGTLESTTNRVMNPVLDYDQSTDEFAQFRIAMPKGWDYGTVAAEVYWTASAGSGAVVWNVAGVAVSNDDVIDAAFGTAQTATDTLLATLDMHRSPETTAITVGGSPADGDMVYFQIGRDADNGSDTLNADARLIGVKLFFNINVGNDA